MNNTFANITKTMPMKSLDKTGGDSLSPKMLFTGWIILSLLFFSMIAALADEFPASTDLQLHQQ